MSEQSRLAELFGAKTGEMIQVRGYEDMGYIELLDPEDSYVASEAQALIYAVNHPDAVSIVDRKPQLTAEELERCRIHGAKYVSRNEAAKCVDLWSEKPYAVYDRDAGLVWTNYDGDDVVGYIGSVIVEQFPSVAPMTCIEV